MKKDIPKIIKAIALENYGLFLNFDDGISGEVSLASLKGKGVFEYWNNENNFKKFQVINNSLTWNDSVDIDSLNLYLKVINKTFEEYANC